MQAAETLERTATPLSVTLSMDEAIRHELRTSEGALEVAKAYEITDGEMAALVVKEVQGLNSRIKRVEEVREGFVRPAQQILANARALFNPALESLKAAKEHLNAKLSSWQEKERQRIEAERRRQEEEARRARQEAERRAAEERAKAEERAREERAKQQAAEEARRKAEAAAEQLRREGDAKAAAEQERMAREKAAEAARSAERERQTLENAEARAATHEQTAAAAAVAPSAQEPAALKGFATRKNWVAELAPGCNGAEDKAKQLLVNAIFHGRTELLALIKIDWSAATKMAKAQEQHMNVPGMVSVNRPKGVTTNRG